jgi:hypothetical protein
MSRRDYGARISNQCVNKLGCLCAVHRGRLNDEQGEFLNIEKRRQPRYQAAGVKTRHAVSSLCIVS